MPLIQRSMPTSWMLFIGSVLLAWAILGIGFRVLYDSVIPEVAAIAFSGFLLAVFNRPQRAWLWLLGLGVGIILSEMMFPVPAPAEHIARYGAPKPFSLPDVARVWAFPAAGTAVGILLRLAARSHA